MNTSDTTTTASAQSRNRAPKTLNQLGDIMLREAGEQACLNGYGTTDREWVGRHALQYGDINSDGTLN